MPFVHCVYFTLKPDTADGDVAAQIADARELLAKIPTVREIDSGLRDATITREVSDTDFDLGLLVTFDNRAGYDVYADHPIHLEYIAKHKDIWSKVRVFDFIAG